LMPPVDVEEIVSPVAIVVKLLAVGGGIWVVRIGTVADLP